MAVYWVGFVIQARRSYPARIDKTGGHNAFRGISSTFVVYYELHYDF